MTNKEKSELLSTILNCNFTLDTYIMQVMEQIDAIKTNYSDFLHTSPEINCDEELGYLNSADYDQACAIMTMLLREDHFCNGSLGKRYERGEIAKVVNRMIELLEE